MSGQKRGVTTHQSTVRLPGHLWYALVDERTKGGKSSVIDVDVEAESELARRHRAEVLARLAEQRADILRTTGLGDDSTPYIRRLREGVKTDE